MKPHFRRFVAVFVMSAALSRLSAAESAVPFRPISFEAATQAATAEGKLLFIDFFTTWCEPCKRLDAQTWTDATVGKLVGEKAVALKLDAEKEGKDLAKRYKIEAYPTLLLLKADGTELDRIVGFREPAKFVTEFSASASGKTSLNRAIDAVSAAPEASKEAVQARYDLARTLAQRGREADALVEYLWCYDEGMPGVASYAGVRNSFLISSIAQLGRRHPPALAALRERRDAAEAKMAADPSNRGAAVDFASLNGALNENERTLKAFDALPGSDPRRAALLVRVYDLLVKAKRYADAAKARPLAKMEQEFDRNIEQMARMATMPRPANLPNPYVGYVTQATVKNVEVLAGSGQIEAARALGEKLLGNMEAKDAVKKQLHDAVARAGQAELF